MSNSGWFIAPYSLLCATLIASCFLNWTKPRSAFTWMLSLVSSVYYAPLWLFSLLLLVANFFLSPNLLSLGLTSSLFLSLTLVFFFKIKNSPLELSEVNWLRLFSPGILSPRPNHQYDFAVHNGNLKVDHFTPPDPKSKTAVFFLFGGGFMNNDQSQLRLFNKRLADLGFHVFALNYRQLPGFCWPTPLDDILKLIEETLKKVSIDTYYVGGRSAGGCLTMMASSNIQDPRHKGSFAIYPVTDLIAWGNDKSANLTLNSRWRVDLLCQKNDVLAEKISPTHLKYSSTKKFLIFSGDFDPLVDGSESERLHEVLIKQGCSSEFHVFKNESHGCDANFDSFVGQKIEKLLVQFLQS